MIRKYKRAYVRNAFAELYQHYKAYRSAVHAAASDSQNGITVGKPKTLRQWLKLDPE